MDCVTALEAKVWEEKVLTYIEDNQNQLFEQLSGLIQIDTQNFKTHGNENNGQEYLASVCRELGLLVDCFAPDSVEGLTENEEYNPGRGTDQRENLVAIYAGENTDGSVMLAAHMDTMPVGDLSQWENPPLSGLIKDNKIYGRGAGDDKFGIALSWYVIKALKECGFPVRKSILLGSYVDEECGGGNGALGLCLKYPCDVYINLDSSGFERAALGGGCFSIKLWSVENDKSIASVFEVFDGLQIIKEAIAELKKQPGTTIRLSSFKGGVGGAKEGSLNFAIYTDKSGEEVEEQLSGIFEAIRPMLQELKLDSDGFKPTTKFFRYGETKADSEEARILAECIEEVTGTYPETGGSCLSDLSIFLHCGSENSFNYGMVRGSKTGGGAHQPNEHIDCTELVKCAKSVALLLMRM